MNTPKAALIATDFSTEAEAARRRAAGIAKETGLSGAIAHVLPASLPVELHLEAAASAQRALGMVVDEMKREGLAFEPRLLSGNVAGKLIDAARDYDMVIAGARGEDFVVDFALGRTSTRLVRAADRPILIVKNPPEGAYRRVVAAVDFSEPSFAAAAWGAAIAPQAHFDLVNAFEVEFESAMRLGGATDDKIAAYRQQAREKAMADLADFSRRLALSAARTSPTATRGYPPRVILDSARRASAQLVVIGKHAAGVVERYLVGSVALQVLEMAKCDVLVVPEARS